MPKFKISLCPLISLLSSKLEKYVNSRTGVILIGFFHEAMRLGTKEYSILNGSSKRKFWYFGRTFIKKYELTSRISTFFSCPKQSREKGLFLYSLFFSHCLNNLYCARFFGIVFKIVIFVYFIISNPLDLNRVLLFF